MYKEGATGVHLTMNKLQDWPALPSLPTLGTNPQDTFVFSVCMRLTITCLTRDRALQARTFLLRVHSLTRVHELAASRYHFTVDTT